MNLPHGNPYGEEHAFSGLIRLRNIHPCHLLRKMFICYRQGSLLEDMLLMRFKTLRFQKVFMVMEMVLNFFFFPIWPLRVR